jgi:16S rRNA processing protein RimM
LTARRPPADAGGTAPASLIAGRVGRPHGLDGSFYVTRPKPRLLSLGIAVTVAERTLSVVRLAGTEQRPIVRLEGILDREGAEALRGLDLHLDAAAAPALAEGEWWSHELEGCAVLDGERLIGRVSRLIELPSCEALEVQPVGGGRALLIPMVKDAVRRVDPGERRIDVDLEFLDLDAGRPPAAGQGESGS